MKEVLAIGQSQYAPIPEGFLPEGVAQTNVDNDVLFLIEHAIPPSIDGIKVFTHLLLHGTLDPRSTMQRSLFQSISEYGDEAIVLIKSVEALAKSKDSPCASETYHKVLLAFEAMHVIRRKFHKSFTEIRIPLGKRTLHLPALLEGLHTMYKKHSNAKFQRFALRVAARLRSGEFATFESYRAIAPDYQPIAQVLLRLLEQHNVKEIRVPSLHEACEFLAQAVQNGRVDPQTSEFVRIQQTTNCEEKQKMGESVIQLGESMEDSPEEQEPAHEQPGESIGTNSPKIPISWATKSKQKGQARLFRRKKGEAETIFAMNSPEFVDSGQISAKLGESVTPLSLSDQSKSNTLTCNRDTTINDTAPTDAPAYKDPRPIEEIRHDAANLAERLDGSRTSRWLAKLITCVQRFPEDVRRLAEIDTLYHSAFPDYRKKPQTPGAWFAKRCEEYANPEWKLIDEIRKWDESRLDLATIHRELRRGLRIPSADLLPFEGSGDVEPPVSLEDEQGVRIDERPSVSTRQEQQEFAQYSLLNTRMDLKQAQTLCKQIRHQTQEFCAQMRVLGQEVKVEADVYEGDHEGEYVVVSNWDGSEEEWTNAAKWNRYFTNVKACYLN